MKHKQHGCGNAHIDLTWLMHALSKLWHAWRPPPISKLQPVFLPEVPVFLTGISFVQCAWLMLSRMQAIFLCLTPYASRLTPHLAQQLRLVLITSVECNGLSILTHTHQAVPAGHTMQDTTPNKQ